MNRNAWKGVCFFRRGVMWGLPAWSCFGLAFAALGTLAWQQGDGFDAAKLQVEHTERGVGFERLDPSVTGIAFTNHLAQSRYTTNQIFLNGSGVAAGDVDEDGLCDLYFCRLDGPNVLYKNRGNWRFETITKEAGVSCPDLDSTGAALADLNGDGKLDLVVNTVGGGTHFFRNSGGGRFQPMPFSPLNPGKGAMSLALADVDRDGDLDLYVTNYRQETIRDELSTNFRVKMVNGKPKVVGVNGVPVTDDRHRGRFTLKMSGKVVENGEVDAFYRNNGRGHFEAVSFTGGAFRKADGEALEKPPYDWGLSAMFHDINGDKLPDLYVCNDFQSPDRFWINRGDWRFQAIDSEAVRSSSMFAMGVDFADLNHDGHDDFFVADMLSRDHVMRNIHVGNRIRSGNRHQYSRNTLFFNRGDTTFAEIGQFSGVHASDWSWAVAFLDVDLDGYEDLILTTGHELYGLHADISRRIEAIRKQKELSKMEQLRLSHLYPRLPLRNVIFRNEGNLSFQAVGEKWGFSKKGVSHGLALADLDNDGDLDLITNNMNEVAGVYRNDTDASRLAVSLKGRRSNPHGIGSEVKVIGGPEPQSREVIGGGRYLSDDQERLSFAAGSRTNRLTIKVQWPSGQLSRIENAKPDRLYRVHEPKWAEGSSQSPASRPDDVPDKNRFEASREPMFRDVSTWIGHRHKDQRFNDFKRQPLMPRRLSQLGPGISWFDYNGDGWDDLIVGSGRGGRLALYRNREGQAFERIKDPPLNRPVTRDQTSILGYRSGAENRVILTGSANYEDGLAIGSIIRQYDLASEQIRESFSGRSASTGPLALADVEGDGDLDLFVGGRCIPAQYPKAASSLLFRREGEEWERDRANSRALKEVGLVSGAVWTDLTGDGYPELALACEWGPIRVFKNNAGKLTEVTQQWGLDETRGWWNGIAAGDLNGDGRMDLVASNWGWNHRYRTAGIEDVRFYYGELTGDDALEVIGAYRNHEMEQVVPFRGLKSMAKGLPFLRQRFQRHEAYGKASLKAILGDRYRNMKVKRIDRWASSLFVNTGGGFETRALPAMAQWAPAFGVSVGDMNGDGKEDIFLSQNFFQTRQKIPRMDAGRGLWLKGRGDARFKPVPGQRSGILIYGEQRGTALGDFNRDGRIDLAVTQNRGRTRLFRNQRGTPGLRVRLGGPPGNPSGVGAMIRVKSAGRWGPAREVHLGSGYWSQDSAVQVMTSRDGADRIRVRWPGGRVVESDLRAKAREITVDRAGEVTRLR